GGAAEERGGLVKLRLLHEVEAAIERCDPEPVPRLAPLRAQADRLLEIAARGLHGTGGVDLAGEAVGHCGVGAETQERVPPADGHRVGVAGVLLDDPAENAPALASEGPAHAWVLVSRREVEAERAGDEVAARDELR